MNPELEITQPVEESPFSSSVNTPITNVAEFDQIEEPYSSGLEERTESEFYDGTGDLFVKEEIEHDPSVFMGSFDDDILNLETEELEYDEVIHKKAMVKDYVVNQFGYEPEDKNEYVLMKSQVAGREFENYEATDEQIFENLKSSAQGRKNKSDYLDQVDRASLLSSSSTSFANPNFENWIGKNEMPKGIDVSRKEVLDRWERTQSALNERYGHVMSEARQLMKLAQDDVLEPDHISEMLSHGTTDEDIRDMFELVARFSDAQPLKEGEPSLFDNFKKSLSRGTYDVLNNTVLGAQKFIAETIARVEAHDRIKDSEEYDRYGENPKIDKSEKVVSDHFNRISEILLEVEKTRDSLSPIEKLTEEGSVSRTFENVLYSLPSTGTSIGVSALPVIGGPLTLGMLERSAYSDIYSRGIETEGVERDEARRAAEATSGKVAAVQLFPQMVGAKLVTGKMPSLSAQLDKLPKLLQSKITRFGIGTTVRASGETLEEEVQAYIGEHGHELAKALEEDLPGSDWDKFFEEAWQRNTETFLSTLVFAGLGSSANDTSIDEAVNIAKEGTRDQHIANGRVPEDVDNFINAEEGAPRREAFRVMTATQDLEAEETARAVGRILIENSESKIKERQEIVNSAIAAQLTPKLVLSPNRETVDIFDNTGNQIAKEVSHREAAELTSRIMEQREAARVHLVDSIITNIEGNQELLNQRGEGVKEISPNDAVTIDDAHIRFAEDSATIERQTEILEKLEGGDGRITKHVFGASFPAGFQGRREQVDALFGGANLFTAIHEHTHETRRRLIQSGDFSTEEQISIFKNIDVGIIGQHLNERVNGQRQRVDGEKRRFLPEDFDSLDEASQEVALDEAFSELSEVLVLRTRNGKKTRFRELLSRNLSSQVKAGVEGANKLKAFVRATREWFGVNLQRKRLLEKAEKTGTVDSAKLDELTDIIFNTKPQDSYDNEVALEYSKLTQRGSRSTSDTNDLDNLTQPSELTVTDFEAKGKNLHTKEGASFSIGDANSRQVFDKTEAKEIARSEIVGKEIVNKDDGLIATVSNSNVNKMLSGKALGKSMDNAAHSFVVANVDTLFEEAVRVSSESAKKEDTSLREVHRYKAPFLNGNKVSVAKLTVKEFANLNEGVKIYSVEVEAIENPASEAERSTGEVPSALAGSHEKLLKKIEDVKTSASFSLGNSAIVDALIGDVTKRIKDPKVKAELLTKVSQRLEGLKRNSNNLKTSELADDRRDKRLKEFNDELTDVTDEIRALDQAFEFDLEKLTESFELKKAQIGEDIVGQFAHRIEEASESQKSSLNREAKARESERKKAANQKFTDAKKLAKSKIQTERATLEVLQESLKKKIAVIEAQNSQQSIRQSLATLDAIVMALPSELRGKVGGYTQIAKLGSDEKRLEFLHQKIEKVDKVVDRWIADSMRKDIDKVFKRAEIKKTTKGIPKAKLAADFTDEINRIKEVSKMTREEVDFKVEAIQEEIEAAQVKEGGEAEVEKLTNDMIFLMGFGGLDKMNGEQTIDFYHNLKRVFDTGMMVKEAKDEQFKQEVKELKSIVNNDATGGKGAMSDQEAKRRNDQKKFIKGLTKFHRQNISFEWLLNGLARENKEAGTLGSKTHEKFATMAHKSTHAEKRANMKVEERYSSQMSDIFGGIKGLNLAKKITKMTEEVDTTGVFKEEYGSGGSRSKGSMRASNLRAIIEGRASRESLGLSKGQYKSALEAYRKREERSKGGVVKDNAVIEYESPNKGKRAEMRLSQDQAINLTMLWKQKDLKESMMNEGYSDATMEQMESYLSNESKQIRDFLRSEYDQNHTSLNEVFKEQMGVNLPKHEFYSPAVRKAQGEVKEMMIDGQGGQAMTTSPGFLISRVKNFAEADQSVGALSTYSRHMAQSNHYIHWAETIKKMRHVFGDAEVKKNVSDYAGDSLLSLLSERIEWMADGGNRKAQHIGWLDKMRNSFTFSSLAYNWGVAIKQLTSLPAYAWDMGIADFGKYSVKFMANPVQNMKQMWELPYTQARFKEGYERDVIDGLKGDGGVVKKMLDTGMMFGKLGDIVPVMSGGWMAHQRAFDKAIADGKNKEEASKIAELTFEMSTDRAQQAGDLKDLSTFQAGGSLFKLFTMFKTSPRQYYANVYESFLDAKAGKKGAAKEFAQRFFIGQMVLPMVFQFASDALRSPFNDEGDEDYDPLDYVRAVLLGPLNGLFIAGDALELTTSGLANSRVWSEKVPILDPVEKAAWGIQDLWDGDFADGMDDILRGTGKVAPSPLTFYEIIRREIDKMNLLED